MASQFSGTPQVKTRTALLIFIKGSSAPIVLYVENPQSSYEEFQQILRSQSSALIEKEGTGPIKKSFNPRKPSVSRGIAGRTIRLIKEIKTMDNKNFLIKIEDIEISPNKTIQFNFEEFIDEIQSNKPIKAGLEIKSLGEFIKVSGHVEGTATLECDLCLESFEFELNFDIDEIFAKNVLIEENESECGQETEIKDGQFITDLNGSDSIDIYDLLYQSVILEFPNKKVCGINCKGNTFLSEEDVAQDKIDPRLAVFKDIKIVETPTEK